MTDLISDVEILDALQRMQARHDCKVVHGEFCIPCERRSGHRGPHWSLVMWEEDGSTECDCALCQTGLGNGYGHDDGPDSLAKD